MLETHSVYMRRCLQLAKNGLGTTYPNPLVGSVVVCDGNIIGEGWHKKAGEPHAEVNAIHAVEDKKLLEKSTIYVNLEPCSHFGKTPPCADLIVKSKIPNVVIGTVDYNSKVYGKGVARLKKHGCNVVVGVLEEECRDVNKRFFTFHQKKRPYIILKWAETLDGFIAPEKRDVKAPVWITNENSQQLVHQWRSEEQSILVGTQTILADNPQLNTRRYFGSSPMRLAIDKKLKITKNYHFYDGTVSTVFFNEGVDKNVSENTKQVKIDFEENTILQILDYLYDNEVQSLIVEGGARTLQQFIDASLWDEARVFIGNRCFVKGVEAPILNAEVKNVSYLNLDKLTQYYND